MKFFIHIEGHSLYKEVNFFCMDNKCTLAEPYFGRFQVEISRYCCNYSFDIRTCFWFVGIDHKLDIAPQEKV